MGGPALLPKNDAARTIGSSNGSFQGHQIKFMNVLVVFWCNLNYEAILRFFRSLFPSSSLIYKAETSVDFLLQLFVKITPAYIFSE